MITTPSPISSPHVSEKHDPAMKTTIFKNNNNNDNNNNNNDKPHDFLPLVEGLLL